MWPGPTPTLGLWPRRTLQTRLGTQSLPPWCLRSQHWRLFGDTGGLGGLGLGRMLAPLTEPHASFSLQF